MRERLLALHAALLGAWLGASILVAAKVAPAAFAAFDTRAEAGSFVGGILRAIYVAALVAGGAGIAISVKRGGRRAALRGSLAMGVVLTGAVSLGITVKIAQLREALGPIDAVPPDDPGRRLFGMLHGFSVLILFAGMISAALAIALEAWSRPDEASAAIAR